MDMDGLADMLKFGLPLVYVALAVGVARADTMVCTTNAGVTHCGLTLASLPDGAPPLAGPQLQPQARTCGVVHYGGGAYAQTTS